jgi:DNA segregation ATPase FtsK/SpoIIIE-like protein
LGPAIVLPAVTSPESLALRVGTDGHTWVDVPVANRAGAVVGGQPGSGKTASLRGMLAGLAGRPDVQFVVIDGKGGTDWEPLSARCFAYLSTVDDLEGVATLLRSIEAERLRRVATMTKLRGMSNFWDAGPDVSMPLIVVAIDECQAVLSKAWHPTKVARDLVDEITGLLLRLVAQGRSAGILCVLATQKPTAESLPTSIRDSAGLKISYSVATRAAADAVLGDGWSSSESGVSPVGAAQGVAVVSDGLGDVARVRSAFVPEAAVADHVRRFASLVIDPRRDGEG